MEASSIESTVSRPEGSIEVDEDQMTAMLGRFRIVVIDCWAPWCGHSRRMNSVFDEVAKELKGVAAFGKVNAAQNHHVPVKFNIRATPTFLVFRDGQVVGRLVGEMTKSDLKARLSTYAEPPTVIVEAASS